MKNITGLFILWLLSTTANAGDIPHGNMTFAEFRELWQQSVGQDSTVPRLEVRWEQMKRTKDNGLDSSDVFAMAEESIKPEHDKDMRWLGWRMLLFLHDDRARLVLKQYLNDADENFRTRIAIDLLHFGEWEAAAPVVAAGGEYGVLALVDKERARPLAEAGLLSNNSDDRYKAALALASYYHDRRGFDQDYDRYTQRQRFGAARILVGTFGDNAEKARQAARDFLLSSDPVDIGPGRERFDAVRFLEHDFNEQDITVFMSVIRGDTMPRYGREVIFAVKALRELAAGGSKMATDSLAAIYESQWWTMRRETIEDVLNRLQGK